jgi:S-adenosylmethionine:tRNA ribosyltransferase-isomerase
VGPGTFLSVKEEQVKNHRMHEEYFSVDSELCDMLRQTKQEGGRVIAVGTTSVRAIESAVDGNGELTTREGWTDLFIFPPYTFRVVDALITNFHLPRSTLLMLVAAFIGREKLFTLYELAKAEGYRYYSYGDAMFLC